MHISSPTEARQAVIAAALTVPLSLFAAALTLGFFGTIV